MIGVARGSRPTKSAIAAVLVAAFAFTLQPTAGADRCPPGYSHADSELRRFAGLTTAEGSAVCVNNNHPESSEELQAMAAQQASIQNAPYASPPPNAFQSALKKKLSILKEGQDAENAHKWTPVGRGPLQASDPGYTSVNGEGLVELSGRITSFFYVDKDRYYPDTLFASVGYGGVWMTDSTVGQWVSIGDHLPTQVVGAVAYTPWHKKPTIIALTGDGSFGADSREGGGAYYTTDGGETWTRSKGIPDEAFGFKLSVDKAHPNLVYAATGSGLYRSENGGRSFANVVLPTGQCAGKSNRVRPCTLANIVTDVVVMAPGGATDEAGGKVLAAVGWRGGSRKNPDGTVQAPANGIYESDSGKVGSFTKVNTIGFAPQARIGRVELGEVVGPDQDHNIVYAMVQDAVLRRNGTPGIDAPGVDLYTPCENAKGKVQSALVDNGVLAPGDADLIFGFVPCKVPTVFNGVYVSLDWGHTWVLMSDWSQLLAPTTGSALIGVASAAGSGPGIQSWYNEWIKPDPTMTDPVTGAPTRLFFGLEEVWENSDVGVPQIGPSNFKVIGRYFAGDTCMFLNVNGLVRGFVPGAPNVPCPSNGTDALLTTTTTHPDQHDAVVIPTRDGVELVVGNDGGVYKQVAHGGADFSNAYWGKGAQQGFNTLLPYDAVRSEDGTVWMGLQDNGTAKIVDVVRRGRVVQRGRQIMTFGGDGFFVAVHPTNSKIAYEEYVYGGMSATTDGGYSWAAMDPPITNGQFSNPFVMDPTDANHLLTAGRQVVETISGPGTGRDDWVKVFDLGTGQHPGVADAAASATDATNQMSALDMVGAAAYVGFCGTCDVLDSKAPFKNGLATNVGGKKKPQRRTSNGWHIAKAAGLPNRYITGVAMDRKNLKHITVTLGGYFRPWTPPGTLDKAKERGGHVYESFDAGEHFTDISENLPNTPVKWVTLRGKQIILATDIGVFVSPEAGCSSGCEYQSLGKNLPAAPVYTVRMAQCDPNLLIAAVYGRGVWSYRFGPTDHSTCHHAKPVKLPPFLNKVLASFDFETGAEGWTPSQTGVGYWALRPPGSSSAQSFQVMPYTDKKTASLTSSALSIPARSTLEVQWDELRNTEDGFDYLTLDWSADGKKWNAVRSVSGENPDFPSFTTVSTRFGVPAGKIFLRFRLTSDDLVSSPAYTGVAVDNVIVRR